MARAMTNQEKQRFRGYFPNLNVNRAVVTGNATRQYNCISWTLGITSRWIWPGAHISNFDTLYNSHGFVRSSNGPIAAWGHNLSNMTHGCISGPGHGPRWESKCGSDLRIQHGLNELVGSNYGRVLAFYARRRFLIDDDIKVFIDQLNEVDPKMKLSDEHQDILDSAISQISDQEKDSFEKLFKSWKESWSSPEFQHLSDPAFVRYTEPFAQLLAMGHEIVPLVIEKLVDPDNFFALQLYDALESNDKIVSLPDPSTADIMEGEQGRAHRTVISWLSQ